MEQTQLFSPEKESSRFFSHQSFLDSIDTLFDSDENRYRLVLKVALKTKKYKFSHLSTNLDSCRKKAVIRAISFFSHLEKEKSQSSKTYSS